MASWKIPKPCANQKCPHGLDGKPKVFRAKKPNQKFCCAKCQIQANNARLVRRKANASASRRLQPCNTGKSACRPWHLNLSLVDAGDGFQTIQGKPRNFGGEMTRLAMANPRVMLRLAAAERNSAERISCRRCELHCEDGVACPRLAAPAAIPDSSGGISIQCP